MRKMTAVAEVLPPVPLEQLRHGGWLLLPIGLAAEQRLTAITKAAVGHLTPRALIPVRLTQREAGS